MELTNDQKGWVLTAASAITCILGSFVICFDLIYKWFKPASDFQLRESKSVLIASLSLSSGVLLFTSLYKLLPEALEYFKDTPAIRTDRIANVILISTYLGGIVLCSIVNIIIHMITSQSVVHCAHEGGPHNSEHEHEHRHHHGDEENRHHHHYHQHSDQTANEATPLISQPTTIKDNVAAYFAPKTFIDITERRLKGRRSIGRCMGYSSVEDCAEHIIFSRRASREETNTHHYDHETTSSVTPVESEEEDGDIKDHHHHVSTRYSHLFSIGLQTALAISVHKIPEGFLTFATSHASPELGFEVFLALAIHNFCEGFTIAFPLYLAIGNRALSIGAAILLGGCSQPVGAVLAWGLFKSEVSRDANMTFGLLVAITSGFLSIIGLQMYGASITYGGKQSTTLAFAFLGIAIIGLSYCLT
jgi:ZIP family zinc transporter